MKTIKVLNTFVCLIVTFLLLVSIFSCYYAYEKKVSLFQMYKFIKESHSDNLIKNGDFKDGLQNWEFDGNSPEFFRTYFTNNISFIEVKNLGKRKQIEQEFLTTSGHVYKINFDYRTESPGTLVLFYDNVLKQEYYSFFKSSKRFNNQSCFFKSRSTGKKSLFLVANQKGDFYFTNVSCYDDYSLIPRRILCFSVSISFVLLILYLFYTYIQTHTCLKTFIVKTYKDSKKLTCNLLLNDNLNFYILLFLILILGTILRVPYLSISPLEYDEAFTVYYSSKDPFLNWSEFLEGSMRFNYFPPLDFFLHHLVYMCLGITHFTIRIVPCFFDLLTIVFIGLLGKRLQGRMLGLCCAVLWALSPTAIYYAMEARLYSQFCFATILYYYSLTCYKANPNKFRIVGVTLCVLYGFNVHMLFLCAFPIGFSALIFSYLFSSEIGLSKRDHYLKLGKDIFVLALCHFVGIFITMLFYIFYHLFTTVKTKPTYTRELYSLKDFWNALLSRIRQTLFSPIIPYNKVKSNLSFTTILMVVFFITLFKRRDVFLKCLVVLAFLAVPFFDIMVLHFGSKYVGRQDIRFVYWFVPCFLIGLAYSIVICSQTLTSLLLRFFKNKSVIQKVSVFIFTIIFVIVFDYNTSFSERSLVQKISKSQYHILTDWLYENASSKKIDFYATYYLYEFRSYDYINLIEFQYKSNVTYNAVKGNFINYFREKDITSDKLKEYLNGNIIMALIVRDKIPDYINSSIFDLINVNQEKLLILKPCKDINSPAIKQYELFFSRDIKSLIDNG